MSRPPVSESHDGVGADALRPAHVVMAPDRLGSAHQHPLSFMRVLTRRMHEESWRIEPADVALNERGDGRVIYRVRAPNADFNFIAFAHTLPREQRSDRVIAEAWDMTAVLCADALTPERLASLAEEVPRQETGRVDADCIVLSRANRSSRLFNHVLDALKAGQQPAGERIASTGYLYRTTAVYGSGKFGMADWQKLCTVWPDLASPFAAEMLTCYLIRQFSLDLVEHLARERAPNTAVPLAKQSKRFLGIGNATGLGMAPFLVNHPLVISRWIEVRETALATVLASGIPDAVARQRMSDLMARAARHLEESTLGNDTQTATNRETAASLRALRGWLGAQAALDSWHALLDAAAEADSKELEELVCSLLMETHVALITSLAARLPVEESYPLDASMSLDGLREQIEYVYRWALDINFEDPAAQAVFWYRSAEKMEPRLGHREIDEGAEKEMPMDIARAVQACARQVNECLDEHPTMRVGELVVRYPQHRRIAARVQALATRPYADIRTNLIDADVAPMHLLRCKLSFFGVAKFDPRSRLWVRNTMFQGAPLPDELQEPARQDWAFATAPDAATPQMPT